MAKNGFAMIEIRIPEGKIYKLKNLVLDYNGTIAVDGIPLDGCLDRLRRLSKQLSVHVITADTFGRVKEFIADPQFSLHILSPGGQSEQKGSFVQSLGADSVIAVGNGFNDHLMIKQAALGLALIQMEGAAAITLQNADAVFAGINDALDALLNVKRLIATLRP